MEQAFRRHAEGLSGSGADGLTLLAVDGTSLRGSFAALKDKQATQILSVFATDGRLILAHVDIDDKTNEIPVAQALIAELKLGDCLFTFDALHCQKKTFQSAAAVGSRVLVQVGSPAVCVVHSAHAAMSTRWRSRGKPARPYADRLMAFN